MSGEECYGEDTFPFGGGHHLRKPGAIWGQLPILVLFRRICSNEGLSTQSFLFKMMLRVIHEINIYLSLGKSLPTSLRLQLGLKVFFTNALALSKNKYINTEDAQAD